jgi:bifunctional ADP-heptose synthase (sugar kinase/adenylyltransferase)
MKVLVIGDNCTDIFRYGKVDRLAPEAPVPVIIPEREESNPGMAGNVVRNLEALKLKVDFITNKTEIKKIRYICSKYNYILLRIDENDKCENIGPLLNNINWEEYHAVVVSDYNKGFLTELDISYIVSKHPFVFLDTKKILGSWAYAVKLIKINYQEYLNNKLIFDNDPILKEKTIITKGKFGCDYQGKNYPTKEVPVKDLSGAGDTFLAGLVTEYLASGDVDKAINFAQECTTIVVQKSGVSTI